MCIPYPKLIRVSILSLLCCSLRHPDTSGPRVSTPRTRANTAATNEGQTTSACGYLASLTLLIDSIQRLVYFLHTQFILNLLSPLPRDLCFSFPGPLPRRPRPKHNRSQLNSSIRTQNASGSPYCSDRPPQAICSGGIQGMSCQCLARSLAADQGL
jgi:hypothetical protein